MDDEAGGTGSVDRAHGPAPRRRRWGRRSFQPLQERSPANNGHRREATYAALDLGTNNCRLLVARPTVDSFRVVDAFSRIIRLGEGLSKSGRLSEAAIERAIEALAICRDKMKNRTVTRARLIATEACRAAENGIEFRARVAEQVGLELEIVDRETEATLAASGCSPLPDILGWMSIPIGVVNLAERHGGHAVTREIYEAMIAEVAEYVSRFAAEHPMQGLEHAHLLGTSGTVTTIAGVHLELKRYERRYIDGCWMADDQISGVIERLLVMSYEDRVANPCIGSERADLVLAGCAILDAIRRAFPCPRVRVADRGLREGMLVQMMRADNVWRRAAGA
jgi:exopolyphosphatase/guanosine-5'-triphosphate,3'-diphosphate pyrophosphatase